MDYILTTHSLTKTYKKVKAVDSVDMHLRRGEIYGFIGENGSGKTTFMRMITGMTQPTSGEIHLSAKAGALIEAPGLYPSMTAWDNLRMKCLACGTQNIPDTCRQLLRQVGLENAGMKRVSGFSLGMRQRLGIALALAGDPEFLVLDEPMNGLDPGGMVQLRELLQDLREDGRTILISSHLLSELSRTATCFGVLRKGRLVREFTQAELEAQCRTKILLTTPEPEKACALLEKIHAGEIRCKDGNIVEIAEFQQEVCDINRQLVLAGIPVAGIGISSQTVEEYYFSLSGGGKNA